MSTPDDLPPPDKPTRNWSPVQRLLSDSLLKDPFQHPSHHPPTHLPRHKTFNRLQTTNKHQTAQSPAFIVQRQRKEASKNWKSSVPVERLPVQETIKTDHVAFKELYYTEKNTSSELKNQIATLQQHLATRDRENRDLFGQLQNMQKVIAGIKAAIPEKKVFEDRIIRLQLELKRAEAKISLLQRCKEENNSNSSSTGRVISQLGRSLQQKEKEVQRLKGQNQLLKGKRLIVKNPPGRTVLE